MFSAVSMHEGQEVYGSTPVSYQSLRKGLLEVFQGWACLCKDLACIP